jgi:hypothetical protein
MRMMHVYVITPPLTSHDVCMRRADVVREVWRHGWVYMGGSVEGSNKEDT